MSFKLQYDKKINFTNTHKKKEIEAWWLGRVETTSKENVSTKYLV